MRVNCEAPPGNGSSSPEIGMAARMRGSRQHELYATPIVVIAPSEWPAAAILLRVDQVVQPAARLVVEPQHLVDHEAHVGGLLDVVGEPVPPGVPPWVRGKVGAATT